MKKVLFTANLDSFFMKFLIPQLKKMKELGYEVHIASKNQDIDIPYCDKKFDVEFARGFNIKQNIKSYKQMKEILNNNNYDLISCHTPFGAAIPRLAARKIKNSKPKIVYTAHGFHFFKGSSFKSWLVYYTMEKFLSKYTDAIITINQEDYKLAQKKMKCKSYYVPGIGISSLKFDISLNDEQKNNLYKELNIESNNYILVFPGEISDNKNQILLLDSLSLLKEKIPNIVLLLPGNDLTQGKVLEYSKKIGVFDCVRFLGYRKDIPQILSISNMAVSSSKREGLPINIIEAMYMSLPIVATNCRGNRDLIVDGENGLLVNTYTPFEFSNKIEQLYNNKKMCEKFIKFNKKNVEKYLIDNVLDEFMKIYWE